MSPSLSGGDGLCDLHQCWSDSGKNVHPVEIYLIFSIKQLKVAPTSKNQCWQASSISVRIRVRIHLVRSAFLINKKIRLNIRAGYFRHPTCLDLFYFLSSPSVYLLSVRLVLKTWARSAARGEIQNIYILLFRKTLSGTSPTLVISITRKSWGHRTTIIIPAPAFLTTWRSGCRWVPNFPRKSRLIFN